MSTAEQRPVPPAPGASAPREQNLMLRSRLAVIELCVARLLAGSFENDAAYDAFETAVDNDVDGRTNPRLTARDPRITAFYRLAWDEMLVRVRAARR